MTSIFSRDKVSHEHCGSSHKVNYQGESAYTFSYSCVKHGKKFSVDGVITPDSKEHAKRRTAEIYKGLRQEIATHKHVAPKKLEKIVKKALHHEHDLKSIQINIKKH